MMLEILSISFLWTIKTLSSQESGFLETKALSLLLI